MSNTDNQLKSIIIHQGSGEDALEMTVQVTQAEFEKMEELRSKNPQKWPEYSLELVKEAKDALAKPSSPKKRLKTKTKSKKRSWLWIVLSIIILAVGIAGWLFTRNRSIVQGGNDLAFFHLNGPVKTVYELEFDAINAFDEESIQIEKPSVTDVYIQQFNQQGGILSNSTISIEKCFLDYYGIAKVPGQSIEIKRYGSKGLFEHSYYEYDQNGNKTKKIGGIIYAGESENNSIETYTYQYDSNGRIIEEKTYYNDGTPPTIASTQYDDLGRIVRYVTETPAPSYYSKTVDYQYTANGYIERTSNYMGTINTRNYLYSESEEWVFDKNNHRNDKFELDEYGNVKEKNSYYYDADSSCYMLKTWDAEGKPRSTYSYHTITTPFDTVNFTITQYEKSTQISRISFRQHTINGYVSKSFWPTSDLSSTTTYSSDDSYHQTIIKDNSTLSIEYDKRFNPKTSIETFTDRRTIKTLYSYKGNKKNWQQIKTIQQGSNETSIITKNYSGYNLLSIIESDGSERHWEYNNAGEIISYKESSGYECRYSDFVYDKYGNWIRRTNYNVLTGTYTVTERCIEYY